MLKMKTFLCSSFLYLILTLLPNIATGQVAPQITQIPEQFIPRDSNSLLVLPELSNQASITELVHWTKIFGPDDVSVAPLTGEVQWEIPSNMASESFYVGLKASTPSGYSTSSFIVHVGKSDASEITYVGSGETYSTIKLGLAAMSAGGTLVVRNGLYAGVDNFIGKTLPGAYQHPPSGSAGELTTVMAETPGGVTLTDDAYIRLNAGNGASVAYACFKGFVAIDGQIAVFSPSNNTRSHHIKFTHCGATGYDATGQPTNPNQQAGQMAPFRAHYSDDILFENCFAYGAGRYKFAAYQSNNIVYRRNVARHDRGTHNGEPKGTYAIYSTWQANVSNNIDIDSDQPDFISSGYPAGAYTTPTTIGDSRATMDRNIQINSVMGLGSWTRTNGLSDVDVSDIISWDVRPAPYYSNGESGGYVVTWGSARFDHATIGNIRPDAFCSFLFNSYHNHVRGLRNSIVHDITNGDLFYNFKVDPDYEIVYVTQDEPNRPAPRYGVDYVNITDYDGDLQATSSITSDIGTLFNESPLYSTGNTNGGLRYLVKIEPGSSLADKSSDDKNMGATVMTFKGKSGTFYGEDGFDEETNVPMWPFPMEDIIHEKFAEYSYTGPTYSGEALSRVTGANGTIIGARGFAASRENLTHYIWGYLGSLVPPMEVTRSTSGILQWNQSIDDGVNSYKIYETDITGTTLTLIDEVDASIMNYDLSEITFSADSYVVVTAVKGSEESGYSYPVSVLEKTNNNNEEEEEEEEEEEAEQEEEEEEEASETLLLMIPNPTSGLVQITQEVEKVDIYDCIGKKVLETSSNTFDTSSMASGLYIVQIKTENKTIIKRLIKNRI
ncbi:T9SS type A sorting domain-containing protein [Aquimarina pacifica]|uniref:T9SS type A sorting domain-containing protein n=1 Tax=Aquimarina pacifica TaxID=1296415 RepID=UPI0004B0C948|nr:T9SS type A sorting domain-containing protein [Aquimarina pacifica]